MAATRSTISTILALTVAVAFASSAFAARPPQFDIDGVPFVKLSSIKMDNLEYLDQLVAMDVSHVRVYLNWVYIESVLPTPIQNYTVAELRANTTWIEPYSETLDWSIPDYYVDTLLGVGIKPLIEIGEGTTHCLPPIGSSSGPPASPDNLGDSNYLAYMYRYCRAAVHRYKDRVGIWQIENELNEAYVEAVSGIRSPSTLGRWRNIWGDWDWVTELLETLNWSVHDEDSSLLTTTNLHTDIPEHVHELLHLPGYYEQAAAQWADYMDVVSFDAYPNYVIATPSYATELGDRAANILAAVNYTLPVMVMEAGYPTANDTAAQPNQVNYTQARQGDYFTDAIGSVVDAGGSGFGVFTCYGCPGFSPPPGGYTDEDIQALELTNRAMQSGRLLPGIIWLLKPGAGHVEYVFTRFPEVVSVVEDGWCLLNPDGSPKEGFLAIQAWYNKL